MWNLIGPKIVLFLKKKRSNVKFVKNKEKWNVTSSHSSRFLETAEEDGGQAKMYHGGADEGPRSCQSYYCSDLK